MFGKKSTHLRESHLKHFMLTVGPKAHNLANEEYSAKELGEVLVKWILEPPIAKEKDSHNFQVGESLISCKAIPVIAIEKSRLKCPDGEMCHGCNLIYFFYFEEKGALLRSKEAKCHGIELSIVPMKDRQFRFPDEDSNDWIVHHISETINDYSSIQSFIKKKLTTAAYMLKFNNFSSQFEEYGSEQASSQNCITQSELFSKVSQIEKEFIRIGGFNQVEKVNGKENFAQNPKNFQCTESFSDIPSNPNSATTQQDKYKTLLLQATEIIRLQQETMKRPLKFEKDSELREHLLSEREGKQMNDYKKIKTEWNSGFQGTQSMIKESREDYRLKKEQLLQLSLKNSSVSTNHEVEQEIRKLKAENLDLGSKINFLQQKNSNLSILQSDYNDRLNKIQADTIKIQEDLKKKCQQLESAHQSIASLNQTCSFFENRSQNLQNYLEKLQGNLRIFCRVKPIIHQTKCHDKQRIPVISYPEKIGNPQLDKFLTTLKITSSNECYSFNRVFDESCTQNDVFQEIVPFVKSAIEGQKTCILAYGQTGSGKTYTIEGPPQPLEVGKSEDNNVLGILPRVLKSLVQMKNHNNLFSVQLSCFQIYNEKLENLLAEGSATKTQPIEGFLKMLESKAVSLSVDEDINRELQKIRNLRTKRATIYNDNSSRSHVIYRLYIKKKNTQKSEILDIVDLAGSEKDDPKPLGNGFETIKADQDAQKKRQFEAKQINQSLLALSQYFRNRNQKRKESHSSLLIRALNATINNDAKILMIVNICSNSENLEQIKQTLQYSFEACQGH